MTFPIRVDLDSAVPIYVQIGKGIRNRLAAGHWKPGDRLPSVRETAVRLRVNPLTVVKAYRALQDEGLLETRPGPLQSQDKKMPISCEMGCPS